MVALATIDNSLGISERINFLTVSVRQALLLLPVSRLCCTVCADNTARLASLVGDRMRPYLEPTVEFFDHARVPPAIQELLDHWPEIDPRAARLIRAGGTGAGDATKRSVALLTD